jgi:ubiquinone biosynthesis protein Coq4
MAVTRAGFFEAAQNTPDPQAVRALLAAQDPGGDRRAFAAVLAHGAFAAPGRIAEIYDAAAGGWTGTAVDGRPIMPDPDPPLPIPQALEGPFWDVVDDALAGRLDAAGITARTAALGGLLHPDYQARAAAAALCYPEVARAAAGPLPRRITLDKLARCPEGSLGQQFHQLIVTNAFDLEVLDRDSLGLSTLKPPLDWLNTRILQAHDLWHIIAGYRTTALHEIAISAFQMAQFGHPYSAQFLAVTAAIIAEAPPEGWSLVTDTVLGAWRHGRETASLVAIAWEDEWTDSTDVIRARHAITPYAAPWPPDIFEQMQAAAA